MGCAATRTFLLSGWLLSRHSEEAIAAGAGVGVGLFLCSLLFSVAAALSLVVSFGPTPYAVPRGLLSLAFSACSIWIIVSGFRIASKAGWGIFWLALSATLIGMTVAYHSLGGH